MKKAERAEVLTEVLVLVTDVGKRNISKSLAEDERQRPKVVMVSSSEKDVLQARAPAETGLGLYTPSGPSKSGTYHMAFLHTHAL